MRTGRGAAHPGGNCDDDPVLDFYLNDFAAGALLAALLPDAADVWRMPTAKGFNVVSAASKPS